MEIRFFKFLSDGTDQELADCLTHLLPEPGSLHRMACSITEGLRMGRAASLSTEVAVTCIEDGHVILFCKSLSRFYKMTLGDWWTNCRRRDIVFIRGPEFNPRPRYRRTYETLSNIKLPPKDAW